MDDVCERVEQGYTLPWAWYSSAEILRAEQERIFRGAWQYAGPAAKVAEPGSYLAARAGTVPVVVTRDRDGELRGFVNVCRHRGAELVEGEGRRETLQCRYHAWTYGLDGDLRTAPRSERKAGFDRSDFPLRPVLAVTWGPFLFVNPALDAQPLEEALGALPELLARTGLDLEGLVFRERAEYELAANWKVAVENYLECYHCAVAHPGFSAVVDVAEDAYRLEEHAGLWSQLAERRDGGGGVHGQFHLLWPNLKVNVFPGLQNLSLGPVWPLGPGRTAGFLDYFFGAGVSDDEALGLLALDDQVGREDTALVESVQRGISSGMLDEGRLLLGSERLIHGFQQRVAAALG